MECPVTWAHKLKIHDIVSAWPMPNLVEDTIASIAKKSWSELGAIAVSIEEKCGLHKNGGKKGTLTILRTTTRVVERSGEPPCWPITAHVASVARSPKKYFWWLIISIVMETSTGEGSQWLSVSTNGWSPTTFRGASEFFAITATGQKAGVVVLTKDARFTAVQLNPSKEDSNVPGR